MTRDANVLPRRTDLRTRARARLTGEPDPGGAQWSASAALGVLHQLASSPATAPDALTVLHELQVYQVELDVQAEELRNSRAELEAELQRLRQVHESAPVGLYVLDADTRIHDLNRTGAELLEAGHDALVGRPLAGLLVDRSAQDLQAMVERVCGGGPAEAGALELPAPPGAGRILQARVSADPAGGRVLVALLDPRSRP